MTATAYSVRPHTYVDSILLMRVARELGARPGVVSSAAVMATPANKVVLQQAGYSGSEVESAGADDLVIGVTARGEAEATAALGGIDALLSPEIAKGEKAASTFAEALAQLPRANLAMVSVPGQHAAAEIRRALEAGLHTFCFSSNVALEDEVELKNLALQRGLLLMGPDCGTAIIAGKGVGFANAVRRGPIGIVGASGTGIQAISSLIHQRGSGVSHALGTGSRDPRDEVGGLSTLAALAALFADPATRVVVLVSKTPGPRTLEKLMAAVRSAPKPVVPCLLGESVEGAASTFDEAASRALRLVGAGEVALAGGPQPIPPRPGRLAGLFAGGSLLLEARGVLSAMGVDARRLELIDMGSEEMTNGRPHPMIDPGPRSAAIERAGEDPTVAAILLDVVLGFGAARDPATDLAPAIKRARARASARGDELIVVASVVGTDQDPQGRRRQEAVLREAGTLVFGTSARAARAAGEAVR